VIPFLFLNKGDLIQDEKPVPEERSDIWEVLSPLSLKGLSIFGDFISLKSHILIYQRAEEEMNLELSLRASYQNQELS
jgi:hypothetical protein